jgi:hypothetical protein
MQATLVDSLRAQLPQIRARWETLLHAEPVTTPLANPGAMVHLIDWTLDEIFLGLTRASSRRRPGRRSSHLDHRHECPCGRNPLLAHFAAGEQALQEALVLVQAALPSLCAIERDASLEELNIVLHQIAHREIASFCGVCQHRQEHCPPNRTAMGDISATAHGGRFQKPPGPETQTRDAGREAGTFVATRKSI